MATANDRASLLGALERDDPAFRVLTVSEKEAVLDVLSEISSGGSSTTLEELYLTDFWRKPPTIEEFLTDDYFLGSVCKPDAESGQMGLIPEMRDDLIEAFHRGREVNCSQLIFTGPIGGGKCQDHNAIVRADTGPKRLRDVKVGDTVMSEVGWRRVTNWIDEGVLDCVRVTTTCGLSMSGSEDKHRIRVLNGLKLEWKFVRDAVPGDVVVIDSGDQTEYAPTFDREFELLGLQSARNGEIVPLSVWGASGDQQLSWLRGWFPCRAEYVYTTLPILAQEVQQLLLFHGVKSSVEPHRISRMQLKDSYRLSIAAGSVERFSRLMGRSTGTPKRRKLPEWTAALPWYLAKIARGEWVTTTVKSVVKEKVHCCDLTVEGNPTYVANGFIHHNTFTGVIGFLFRMSRALCLRQPQLHYKLSGATTLNFYILSITREQVMDGAFGDCLNMMRASPFFTECCAEDLTKKEFKNQTIRFRRNVLLQAGSKARHAIGRNTLGAFMDEVNFRLEKNAQGAAKEMYDAITRRTNSRFGKSNDGILVLVSSSRSETDFLATHIRAQKKNLSTKVIARAYWDGIGKYKILYSGAKFKVDPGDHFTVPKILGPTDDIDSLPQEVQGRIIEVPIEHFDEFESDLTGSVCDIAGLGASSTLKFFYNHLHLVNTLRDDVIDIFSGLDEVALSVECGYDLWDYIDLSKFIIQTGGGFSPRRHPASPRFLHIDMSSGAQDNMGLTMVHPVWSTEVDFIDPSSQARERRIMPTYEVDFTVGVKRDASGKEIDFGKIRKFIFWLRDQGFRVTVTCDLLAMSLETISILKQNGFDASYMSVDKTKVPYMTLRQAIAEGRISVVDKDLLFSELVNLDDEGKKVDHPVSNTITWKSRLVKERGSKDLSDSLAGAVTKAETAKESFNLPMLREGEAAVAEQQRQNNIPVRRKIRTF